MTEELVQVAAARALVPLFVPRKKRAAKAERQWRGLLQHWQRGAAQLSTFAAQGMATLSEWQSMTEGLANRLAGGRTEPVAMPEPSPADVTFSLALLALAGKVMRCDGPEKPESWAAFHEAFPMPGMAPERQKALLDSACREGGSTVFFARCVMLLHEEQVEMRREVLQRLTMIAAVDGPLSLGEYGVLRDIGKVFALEESVWSGIIARAMGVEGRNAFQMLQVKPRVREEELKRAYREQLQTCHPDRLRALVSAKNPVDTEWLQWMARRAGALHEAYQTLLRKKRRPRGMARLRRRAIA